MSLKEKSELITELSNQILGLRQKIGGDWNESLCQLRQSISQHKMKQTQSAETISSLEVVNKEMAEEISKLQGQVGVRHREVMVEKGELQSSLESLQHSYSELQAELRSANSDVSKQKVQHRKELQQLRKQIQDDFKAQLTDANKVQDAAREAYCKQLDRQLHSLCSDLKSEADEKIQKLAQANKSNLLKARRLIEVEYRALKEGLVSQHEVNESRSDERVKKAMEEIQKKLDASSERRHKALEESRELQSKYDVVVKEQEKQRKRTKTFQIYRSNKPRQIKNLTAQLERSQKQVQDLQKAAAKEKSLTTVTATTSANPFASTATPKGDGVNTFTYISDLHINPKTGRVCTKKKSLKAMWVALCLMATDRKKGVADVKKSSMVHAQYDFVEGPLPANPCGKSMVARLILNNDMACFHHEATGIRLHLNSHKDAMFTFNNDATPIAGREVVQSSITICGVKGDWEVKSWDGVPEVWDWSNRLLMPAQRAGTKDGHGEAETLCKLLQVLSRPVEDCLVATFKWYHPECELDDGLRWILKRMALWATDAGASVGYQKNQKSCMDILELDSAHKKDEAHQLSLTVKESTIGKDIFPKVRVLSSFCRNGDRWGKLANHMLIISGLRPLPTVGCNLPDHKQELIRDLIKEYQKLQLEYQAVIVLYPVTERIIMKVFMKGVKTRFYYELPVIDHFLELLPLLPAAIWMQYGFMEHTYDWQQTTAFAAWEIASDPINAFHCMLMQWDHSRCYRRAWSDMSLNHERALPTLGGDAGLYLEWQLAFQSALCFKPVRIGQPGAKKLKWLPVPNKQDAQLMSILNYAAKHFPRLPNSPTDITRSGAWKTIYLHIHERTGFIASRFSVNKEAHLTVPVITLEAQLYAGPLLPSKSCVEQGLTRMVQPHTKAIQAARLLVLRTCGKHWSERGGDVEHFGLCVSRALAAKVYQPKLKFFQAEPSTNITKSLLKPGVLFTQLQEFCSTDPAIFLNPHTGRRWPLQHWKELYEFLIYGCQKGGTSGNCHLEQALGGCTASTDAGKHNISDARLAAEIRQPRQDTRQELGPLGWQSLMKPAGKMVKAFSEEGAYFKPLLTEAYIHHLERRKAERRKRDKVPEPRKQSLKGQLLFVEVDALPAINKEQRGSTNLSLLESLEGEVSDFRMDAKKVDKIAISKPQEALLSICDSYCCLEPTGKVAKVKCNCCNLSIHASCAFKGVAKVVYCSYECVEEVFGDSDSLEVWLAADSNKTTTKQLAAQTSLHFPCSSCADVFPQEELHHCAFCEKMNRICEDCIFSLDGDSRYCSAECQDNAVDQEEEVDAVGSDDDDNIICDICKSGDDQNKLLLCDGRGRECPIAVHVKCAGLDHIPAGRWYCPACQQAQDNQAAQGADNTENLCNEWLRKHNLHLKRNYLKEPPVKDGSFGIICYPQYDGTVTCCFKQLGHTVGSVELEYLESAGAGLFSELANDRSDKHWVEERKNWAFLNPIKLEQAGVSNDGLLLYKIATKGQVYNKIVEKYELYKKSNTVRLCKAAYGANVAVVET